MNNLAYDIWKQDDAAANSAAATEIEIEIEASRLLAELNPSLYADELAEELIQSEQLEEILKCQIISGNNRLMVTYITTATEQFMNNKAFDLAEKLVKGK